MDIKRLSAHFTTQKKGEAHELRNDLNSNSKDKIKEAVKRVIAMMTVGQDVSSLFTDVIKCMHTDDLELKKLIYLYIINYARTQPEKAILVVAAFQNDTVHFNPLIRALAIRTMGCIRVERITQFLCDPLHQRLADENPYVRKTSAICVAKLYDLNPELVEDQGFLDILRNMLTDGNHTVVANAVASLMEIAQTAHRPELIALDADLVLSLLAALNACTEWGQVSILECLATYIPSSSQEAEDIIERVSPRLKHANAAVAMCAIKLILAYIPHITNEQFVQVLLRQKIPPPLITLLSDRRPEIQYIALRHIELLIQKYPTILTPYVKHFFCKFSDTQYVKVEKVDILVRLITSENMDKVLLEFKEYACEADVDFVRKAIRAIGRCAIHLPECSQHAVAILLSLIENRVNYVVQESIIVIKNVFRRYPEQYESIISTLCAHLDSLDDNEAKSAMIWIIGEYCHRIDNSHELLSLWAETFLDEQPSIQLQLLTASVKLFLKQPDNGQELVTSILTLATKQVDSPDVRDRALIYWRLLSTDADLAIKIVFAQKPNIRDDSAFIDPDILDDLLLKQFSTLSCIYHKPAVTFVKAVDRQLLSSQDDDYLNEPADDHLDGGDDDYVNPDDETNYTASQVEQPQQQQQQAVQQPIQQQQQQQQQPQSQPIDLLGLTGLTQMDNAPAPVPIAPLSPPQNADLLDMFGLGGSTQPAPVAAAAPVSADPILLPADKGQGVEIRGKVIKNPENTPQTPIALSLTVTNNSAQALAALPLRFNANYFGLTPAVQPKISIAPGASASVVVPCGYSTTNLNNEAKSKNGLVQIAVKLTANVGYFAVEVPGMYLFQSHNLLDQKAWLQKWAELKSPENHAVFPSFAPAGHYVNNDQQIISALQNPVFGLVNLASRSMPNGTHLFFSSNYRGINMLLDIVTANGLVSIQARADDVAVAQLCAQSVAAFLQA